MAFTGQISCLKGRTDFYPGPRDSSLDCVGERAATNRMRTEEGKICCLKGNTSIKYMIKITT